MNPPTPSVPSFVVLGMPNDGKTTFVATLLEDEDVAINNVPGTTKKAVCLSYELKGEQLLEVWDTPGFQNTPEVAKWFSRHGSLPDAQARLEKFLGDHHSNSSFSHDCQIVRAILAGGVVVVVVDDAREPTMSDGDVLQVLCWCGRPRLAIFNTKTRIRSHREKWLLLFSQYNLHWMEFNACEADSTDKMNLLRRLTDELPPHWIEWRQRMTTLSTSIEELQQLRLRNAAAAIRRLVEDVVKCRETCKMPLKQGKEAAKEAAKTAIRLTIRKRESAFRTEILGVFNHRKTPWNAEPDDFELLSEAERRTFGLTDPQLIAAGAAIGATMGAPFELLFPSGIPTTAGALIGGVLAWSRCGKNFEVTTTVQPRLRIPTKADFYRRMAASLIPPRFKANPAIHATARLDIMSNAPWVLIGRSLDYCGAVARWPHGKRESPPCPLQVAAEAQASRWEDGDRKAVSTWIGHLSDNSAKADVDWKIVEEILVAKLGALSKRKPEIKVTDKTTESA